MKVTIKDIAKECGVSTTAVSLVLNNREARISAETRKRILDTVEKYNYRPNKLAIGLLKNNTSTFGIIVPDIGNIYFAELCKGCESEARKHNYTLMVTSANEFPDNNMQYFDALIDHQVDGIVYVAPSNIDNHAIHSICSKITETKIPFVAVDRALDLPFAKSIVNDNVHGGYIATKHLLELGHRRIGCLTGPLCNRTSSDRLQGYKTALDEFGVSYNPALIMEGDFTVQSGYDSLAYMRGQDVTALFCFNDMMALGAYRAIRDYKLHLPESISLVGYDDIFISDLLDPPLTTVNQPAFKIGESAINTLIALTKNDASADQVVFTPNLKVRSSTAPPSQRP
ncbi:MAG: LacI family transcriptional regulator [Clostridiales bacterium]|nr:LacI family transcriptional regulator [Clostridiales bacterium]